MNVLPPLVPHGGTAQTLLRLAPRIARPYVRQLYFCMYRGTHVDFDTPPRATAHGSPGSAETQELSPAAVQAGRRAPRPRNDDGDRDDRTCPGSRRSW